jgi:V/A-type H+/Na+-transporting ATPase subunit F
MAELIVIGTPEFLPGFALAGVRKTILATPVDAMQQIRQHQDAGIIILDEKLTLGMAQQEREQLDASVAPVIITLAKDGTNQKLRLKRAIMNTLGVDLLK